MRVSDFRAMNVLQVKASHRVGPPDFYFPRSIELVRPNHDFASRGVANGNQRAMVQRVMILSQIQLSGFTV